MTASRLYRSTPGVPRPLFTVTAGARTYTDDQVHSITITHGKDGPEGGLHPATCEVEVAGSVGLLHDRNMRVTLSTPAANALGLTATTAPQAVERFTGRVATQTVRESPRRGHPARLTSRLMGSSWSSLYLASGHVSVVHTYTGLTTALDSMLSALAPRVGVSLPVSYLGDWNNATYAGTSEGTLSEQIDKYFGETGFLIRQTRAGRLHNLTAGWRVTAGENAAANWLPITLGHVAETVEHRQDTDVSARGIRLTYRVALPEGGNEVRTVPWAWAGSSTGTPASSVLEWEEYDWTHLVFFTEQYRNAINAISHRAFRVAYTTPSITVDLLALARSPRTYDRAVLHQLLMLEQGDPVVLGTDWGSEWSGLQYAEQITEHITPDAWTLTLALYPPQEVTGRYGVASDPAPSIPARLWNQHRTTWTTTEKTWS